MRKIAYVCDACGIEAIVGPNDIGPNDIPKGWERFTLGEGWPRHAFDGSGDIVATPAGPRHLCKSCAIRIGDLFSGREKSGEKA